MTDTEWRQACQIAQDALAGRPDADHGAGSLAHKGDGVVSDLIEREALVAKLRGWEKGARRAAAGVPMTTAGGVQLRIHNASATAFALAATATEQWPTSTRYAELERAAREILAGIDESERGGWWCPTCRTWVPGKEVSYYEIHEVCNTHVEGRDTEPETITALRAAIAALDAERGEGVR